MTPIPASEKDFRIYVKRSGFIDITRVSGDDEGGLPRFLLSTEKQSRRAYLYSKTRPEPRFFASESAIIHQLIKWGFKVAALPVVDGSSRCYLEDPAAGIIQPSVTVPFDAASRGPRLVASR